MSNEDNLSRYSVIENKDMREMVLLRGTGCKWPKCSFCDYYLDASSDEAANFVLNKKQLDKLKGTFGTLDVFTSGSFLELGSDTLDYIMKVCIQKKIKNLIFECHFMYKDRIKDFQKSFFDNGISLKVRTGIETFDYLFRESYLLKGIGNLDASEIAKYFDQVSLLQGLPGQSTVSMIEDINIGLKYFERIHVNIMTENSTPVKPSLKVIEDFKNNVYPLYINNPRVDIFMSNTEFGIGKIF